MEQIDQLAEQTTRTALLQLIELDLRGEEPSLSLSVVRNPERRLDLIYLTRECLRVRGGVRALRAAVVLMFPLSGPVSALLDECDRVLEQEPRLLAEEDRIELLDVLDGIALTARADVPSLFVEATKPVPIQTTASTMRGAVRQLERRGTAVPLLRFLELLANNSDQTHAAESLRAWIDAHLTLVEPHRRQEVTSMRGGAAGRPDGHEVRTCLLVRVEPLEDDTYTVMAWMGQTDSTFGPNCGPEDVVTLAELQEWLRQLIEQYAHGALDPKRRPLIEFIMPSSHLNESVDTWKLAGGQRLGVHYQVTVRPLSRAASAAPLLSDRWKALVASAGEESPAPTSMRWLESTAEALRDDPDCPEWAWIAVTCPRMAQHTEAIDAVLATGAPVAAWLRGSQTDQTRRAVLEGLSRGRLVTHFPDAVRKFRENGWKDGSDHRDLVLLWDDPTRPPPQDYLINAPE